MRSGDLIDYVVGLLARVDKPVCVLTVRTALIGLGGGNPVKEGFQLAFDPF